MVKNMNSFLKIINRKVEFRRFLKRWKETNPHNSVVPIKKIDMSRVKIGCYSYGTLDLYIYNKQNSTNILKIGNFVSIASGVMFFLDGEHQCETFTTFPLKSIFTGIQNPDDSTSKGSIIVEDEVWIGANSTIMSGVKIGKGAIIATGSVVISDVPPYSIVGGVPAKIIKLRFKKEIIKRLLHIKLIDIPKPIIEENMKLFYDKINLEVIERIEKIINKNEIV